MLKLVVLWNLPSGMNGSMFDELYFNHHVPLAKRIPGLRRYVTTKFIPTPNGTAPAYYRMAELYYDDEESLAIGRASDVSRRARRQIENWRWRDVRYLVGEATDQELE